MNFKTCDDLSDHIAKTYKGKIKNHRPIPQKVKNKNKDIAIEVIRTIKMLANE